MTFPTLPCPAGGPRRHLVRLILLKNVFCQWNNSNLLKWFEHYLLTLDSLHVMYLFVSHYSLSQLHHITSIEYPYLNNTRQYVLSLREVFANNPHPSCSKNPHSHGLYKYCNKNKRESRAEDDLNTVKGWWHQHQSMQS